MDYAEFLGFSLDETLLENSCHKIQYISIFLYEPIVSELALA